MSGNTEMKPLRLGRAQNGAIIAPEETQYAAFVIFKT